jgi:protein phosphatase
MQQYNTPQNGPMLHIHAAGRTATGRLREQNEDAFVLSDVSDEKLAEQLGRLYVLADGTGGNVAGETASQIAIQTIPGVYYHQSEGDSPLIRLQQAFSAADSHIRERSSIDQKYAGIATTCTAVVVRGTRLWIGHIGDSRAYLVHTSSQFQRPIERLTTDHSQVASQVRAGNLSHEQMRRSPEDRDVLLRALGQSRENNSYPDFIMCNIHPGDALVLCSDGLWGALTEEQIASIVQNNSAQQACDELVRLAGNAGGDEDISAILLSFF